MRGDTPILILVWGASLQVLGNPRFWVRFHTLYWFYLCMYVVLPTYSLFFVIHKQVGQSVYVTKRTLHRYLMNVLSCHLFLDICDTNWTRDPNPVTALVLKLSIRYTFSCATLRTLLRRFIYYLCQWVKFTNSITPVKYSDISEYKYLIITKLYFIQLYTVN